MFTSMTLLEGEDGKGTHCKLPAGQYNKMLKPEKKATPSIHAASEMKLP